MTRPSSGRAPRTTTATRGHDLTRSTRPAPSVLAVPTRRRRARTGGLLFLAALGLILSAYVFSNPPGAASDEPSHLVKAAALSVGQVRGTPIDYAKIGAWSDAKVDWTSRTSRVLRVPTAYAGCDGFTLPVTGSCSDSRTALSEPTPADTSVSYVATYPVLPYLLPALGIRLSSALGGGPGAGLLAARIAGALAAAAFAAGAVRLLLRGNGRDLVVLAGTSLAVTPMLLFTCAQVSDSGLELTSGLCFGAALLRLARPAPLDLSPRAVWFWTAASGLVLADARTLGPMWLAALVGVVLALRGRRLVRAVRTAPWAAGIALGLLATATGASLVWQSVVEPHPRTSLLIALRNVPSAVRQLLGVADMYVGRFGWISIRLPLVLVVGWLLLLAGLLAVAARLGTRRERVALAVSLATALGVTVFVAAYAILPTAPDFVMQARYVMPALTMVPLVAVDVLRAHAGEAKRRWGSRPEGVATAVLLCVTVAQVVAFATNVAAYRHTWRPPLGWAVWEGAVLTAAVAVLAGTVRLLRAARRQPVAVPGAPVFVPVAAPEHPLPRVPDPVATGAR